MRRNERGPIVQTKVGLVVFDGVCVAMQLDVHIAQLLEGPRRPRIELGGHPQVA